MRNHLLKSAALAVTPAALLALAACSSSPSPTQGKVEPFSYEAGGAGFGGQVIVDTTTTNATVVSINSPKRTLVLKYPDGKVTTYKAGPEVAKFSQIKVGDEVKATRVDEFALSLAKAGTLQSASVTDSAVAAPNGMKPGVKTVHVLSFTAKVLSIDLEGHQATLQMADGRTRTVRVRESVNLADFNPGDIVSIRTTETTTILVRTP